MARHFNNIFCYFFAPYMRRCYRCYYFVAVVAAANGAYLVAKSFVRAGGLLVHHPIGRGFMLPACIQGDVAMGACGNFGHFVLQSFVRVPACKGVLAAGHSQRDTVRLDCVLVGVVALVGTAVEYVGDVVCFDNPLGVKRLVTDGACGNLRNLVVKRIFRIPSVEVVADSGRGVQRDGIFDCVFALCNVATVVGCHATRLGRSDSEVHYCRKTAAVTACAHVVQLTCRNVVRDGEIVAFAAVVIGFELRLGRT